MSRARVLCVVVAFVLGGGCGVLAQQANPITNGGFEELTPQGLPVGWQIVGERVVVTHDAHSGRDAMLLDRTQAAIDAKQETGLNRAWKPDSGEQGAMLSQLKGGVRFWYKVPQADPNAHPTFFMIPMSADPMENTGGQRAQFVVPPDQFGDGQWHQGLLAYNFTDNAKCKWAMVAPRLISSKPARWIIDDIQWVPSVGAVPSVQKMKLAEVSGQEGHEAVLSAELTNSGDKPFSGTATLKLPDYLQAQGGASQSVGPIAPGITTKIKWTVTGERDQEGVIGLSVTGGAAPAGASLKLAPALANVRVQMKQFVLWPGKETTVSLLAENKGTSAVHGLKASLSLPPEVTALGDTSGTIDTIEAGSAGRLDFRVRAAKQTPGALVQCRWQDAAGASGDLAAACVVGAPAPTPDAAPEDAARVACQSFEILFPHNDFGYGIGWVYARPGGELVGAIPALGRLVVKGHPAVSLYAPIFRRDTTVEPFGMPLGAKTGFGGITFRASDAQLRALGLRGPLEISFSAAVRPGEGAVGRTIDWRVTCPAPATGDLLALDGPMLYVGEGSFAPAKDEALYPGLEWLKSGEHSSSSLDIAADHPERFRYVVNPRMVTMPLMALRDGSLTAGIFWDERATWNDGHNRADLKPDESDVDRPSSVFASPDWMTVATATSNATGGAESPSGGSEAARFGGHASTLMGLFVPTVPAYVEVNHRQAPEDKGWPAPGVDAHTISLQAAIYVNPDTDSVLDAVRAWTDIYGLPAPRNLPRGQAAASDGSRIAPVFRGEGLPDWARKATTEGQWVEPTRADWVREVDFSSGAYLKSLWIPDKNGWMGSKGGPPGSDRPGVQPQYLYDCVMAARLTGDAALRRQLDRRIALVQRLDPGTSPAAEDLGFNFGRPMQGLLGLADEASAAMGSQDPDGGWRFHPHIPPSGIFKGYDYARNGYEGEQAIGLCAHNAYYILHLARLTGDAQSLAAGLKALHYMDKFTIPRAAQVWEVPVHTPDILASSDACEAYLEGYWATGDRHWLDKAVYWEETGLPFVYMWGVNAFPWMRYASIPVFGASLFEGAWFGQPVQWNGLRWAYAALKLAQVDNSYPWRMLAGGVTVSAMYQQGTKPDDLALWPDNLSTATGVKAGWIFAPRQILLNVYRFLGYDPEPNTAIVPVSGGKVRVDACGALADARLDGNTLKFTVTAPTPVPTRVLVCGIAPPTTVTVNGAELPQRQSLAAGPVVGWHYSDGYSILDISPGQPGRFEVEVTPATHKTLKLAAAVVTKIDFGFGAGEEGWRASNDLTPLVATGGNLVSLTTGGDPYMVRPNCRIAASSVKRIVVRMSVSAGSEGELYWTTVASPGFAEDKTAKFQIKADGQMHTYTVDMSKVPAWTGMVTSLRLDPGNGATGAKVRIDYVRGEP